MFDTAAAKQVHSFVQRAARLDPAALIRLRPAGDRVELWTVLPFGVLATTAVPGDQAEDVTVLAAELAASLPAGPLPARHDRQWRGALPSGPGRVLEELSATECRQLGTAAAQTLQQSRGKGVGDRRLRDTLLEHVALRVLTDGTEHQIQLRLVLGLLRMGLAPTGKVRVRESAGRLGLSAERGAVWNPAPGLSIL